MGEEFQGGICGGGNWWSSSRNMLLAVGGLSSCSMGIGDLTTYGWPPTTTTDDFLDIKPRSCSTDHHSNSVSDNSVLFQDNPKPQNSDSDNNNLLFDSTLQMMGFALSSSSDWNQNDLLYNDQIRKDWSPSNLCGDININSLKQAQAQEQAGADHDFFLNQNRVNSINCSSDNIDSTLYGYPSKMLQQSLYDSEPDPLQDHQSLFNTGSNNNSFCPNSNDLSLSSPNFPSYLKPSLPKHPLPAGLNFINNTPFWNASAAAASTDVRQGLVPSSQSQVLASILEEKILKANGNAFEDGQDSGSVLKKSDKNSTTEPLIKRPRIETPSPLPTFKVRKEKLGDRVTALQQLVSPFGKTDTASVLHEAIEYIKFLHDQVSVLSTPYMKSNNGAPIQIQQVTEKLDPDCPKQDLRTRGLCLVPISSTFPVTNATPSDFWTPTFGGTFR